MYELGKDFRNEGVSHKHNPEFTMLETYEAYADYNDVAAMTEELVAHAARETIGTTVVERDGETIDLAPPWRRVTLRDAILEQTGIDIAQRTAIATRWHDAMRRPASSSTRRDRGGASSSTSSSRSMSSPS